MKESFYLDQKDRIFNSLSNFHSRNFEFSLTIDSNPSPFATIFSIFIKDLFNYHFSKDEKKIIIRYLNRMQDKETGLFFDFSVDKPIDPFYDKKTLQLTTFALSALAILKVDPKYDIHHPFLSKNDIFSYLNDVGVKRGKLGSGNFSMFLGIFLSIDKINSKNNLLDYWFEYHNLYSNSLNGVWTSGIQTFSQWSYQNALHQLMIYEYWEKDFKNSNQLIDIIIKNVDKSGTFSLLPGGGACCDYDAIHILNVFGIQKNYRKNDILNIFNLTYKHILEMSKEGFCENNYVQKLSLPKDLFKFSNNNIISTIFRIKEFMHYKNKNFTHHPHWSKNPIKLNDEDLWSIWFRLLVIAEIESVYIDNNEWKFQNFPGLGILKKEK